MKLCCDRTQKSMKDLYCSIFERSHKLKNSDWAEPCTSSVRLEFQHNCFFICCFAISWRVFTTV